MKLLRSNRSFIHIRIEFEKILSTIGVPQDFIPMVIGRIELLLVRALRSIA